MKDNNINIKKRLIIVLAIVMIVLIALTGTYAWYVWSSNEDDITHIVTGVGAATVVYHAGDDLIGQNVMPVSDKSLGIVKNITVRTSTETTNDITFNLYLDINYLDDNLKHSSFKYALYDDNDNVVSSGNFASSSVEECNIDNTIDHIVLANGEVIDTTISVYTLYIWIDGNVDNPVEMQGKNFNFTLHADGENALIHESQNTNIIHNDVIPVGGTYMVGVTYDEEGNLDTSNAVTYIAGQAFPETVNVGDIYIYGDYEYRYGYSWCCDCFRWDECYDGYDGWGVAVRNRDKTNYGDIVSVINGENVVSLTGTFGFCYDLIIAPDIPSTIRYMNSTFYECANLANAPKLPEGLLELNNTFGFCTSLLEAPVIPNSVTSMDGTFEGCSRLVNAPVIPNSVTSMDGTFSGCESLVNAPVIPNSVTNMNYTFYSCINLVNAPVIPNSVTSMNGTFEGCARLVNAPVIPNSVTSMDGTFSGCESLVSAPVIPNSVTSMSSTFFGCTNLVNAPVIPSSVTYMWGTFQDCTSLTGTVRINSSNVTDVTYIFSSTSKAITVEVPSGSTTYTKLDALNTSNGMPSNVRISTY